MATGMFAVIYCKGTQAGQSCDNRFIYYQDTDIPGLTSQQLAEAFYDDVWTAEWKTLVTDDFTLLEIQASTFQSDQANNSPLYIRGVNETGEVVDQSLGPNIVINQFWVPDNDELYPTDVEIFKKGRTGFSGIPENAQDDGLVTDTAMLDWNALGEAIRELTVTVSGTPHGLPLALTRQPQPNADPPILYPYNEQPRVPILTSYTGQKLGTRNSRKR